MARPNKMSSLDFILVASCIIALSNRGETVPVHLQRRTEPDRVNTETHSHILQFKIAQGDRSSKNLPRPSPEILSAAPMHARLVIQINTMEVLRRY